MGKKYNGWRELKIQSEYNRRKLVRNQRIFFGIGVGVLLVAVICGGIFLWRHFRGEDAQNALNSEVVLAETLEPTTIPTVEPTAEPVEVIEESCSECIVLDAGHGNVDGGTSCEDALEKDINFAVVMYMKDILEATGIEVRLTRSGDDFMVVSERADFANQNKEDADLFVSIHCNYFEDDDSVSGLEIYYYTGDEGGQACAESMIEYLKKNEDIKVRSAKHGEYYVLKFTEIPSVLVEMGFLSNKAEREKLDSEAYQKLLAEELSEAVLQYLEESAEQKTENVENVIRE